MFKVIGKEFAEFFIRNGQKLCSKSYLNHRHIQNELRANGYSVESDFLSKEQCEKYIKKIDSLIGDSNSVLWEDDTGSDQRIYFVDTIDLEFAQFFKNKKVREILEGYNGITKPKGLLLAAKLNYKKDNLGSGGGWHRDSPITHQFKAVCYLNDVHERNGPFQYVKGSHRKLNVIRNYLTKVFNAGQYRFSDSEVERYLTYNKNNKVNTLTAKAGTLIYADTKGIHRGKPIEEGSRYVLFCYFWNKSIPSHFSNLAQNK